MKISVGWVEEVETELHLISWRVARKVPHHIIIFLKYFISCQQCGWYYVHLFPLYRPFALMVKEKW